MECAIQSSPHAMDRKIERGISNTELIEAINKVSMKIDQKKVISYHRGIGVVYKKKPCHIFIVTLYWGD